MEVDPVFRHLNLSQTGIIGCTTFDRSKPKNRLSQRRLQMQWPKAEGGLNEEMKHVQQLIISVKEKASYYPER